MPVNWNGKIVMEEFTGATARGLLAAAVFFQNSHKALLNVSNPRPYQNSSKPGEYPRARTGFGRNGCMYEPTSEAGVKAAGHIKIGFRKNAFYMLVLELFRKRKGLRDTLKKIKQQLAAVALRGAKGK